MQKRTLILWLIVSFSRSVFNRKLPNYVKVCRAEDPALSKCWRESLEALIPYLTQDRPELNLPSLDPFHLSEVRVSQDSTASNLYLNVVLNDVEVTGVSGLQVLNLAIDLKDYSHDTALLVPHTSVTGKYKTRGKILAIEFDGEGTIHADFTSVTYNSTWIGKTYSKKGRKYLEVEEKGNEVNVGKIYMHLNDLFRGNPELTENVNKVINENTDFLFKEFQPFVKKAISDILLQSANRFYGEFPLDVLYPKNYDFAKFNAYFLLRFSF